LTPTQLGERLVSELKTIVRKPKVSITIVDGQNDKVYVVGGGVKPTFFALAKNVDAVWRSTAGRPTGKAITAGTLVHIAQEAGYRVPTKQTKPTQQITTPSRHSFVMPAPNYGALDEAVPVGPMDDAVPVSPMDEAVPVSPMDDAVPVSPMDEAVPVGPIDEAVKQALRSAGWIHHYTEIEAEQNDWNNSPGVRWAKQIRQRGTSLNAVPYYERQTARQ